ncbi:protein trichome birefringence-like 28 [Triticum dicoccoides]|uniref:protein trichome birefringence-like 28 n=1 Tax=Triticum dicoccoides TaxID=85692 RepID=UPI00188FBFA9|nr:protein trichome birefringence-like 28 [Triticum dicoccoides]
MRIPRRKAGVPLGVPSRRAQIAAVFALAVLLGVSVLYDSAHIAASLRRHSGYNRLSPTREAPAGAGPRATPAQAVESAGAATDRTDPPPRLGAEGVSKSNPGTAADGSSPETGVLKEVVAEGGEATCDMYKGRWVHDEENAPMYKESDCEFLTEQVTCMRNGRRSDEYQKWRWQPDACDLPRFDAKLLLEKLRNKRMMFVGDSLNRNQWESMVCLVQSVAPWDKKKLVKNGSLNVFRLHEYNATIEFYWAPFLVESNSDDPDIHSITDRMIMPTSIAKHAANWIGVDYLIFNTYIWWMNTPKMKIVPDGSFTRKPVKYDELDRVVAYRQILETWSGWVEENVDPKRTMVLFMSVSPVHMQSEGWGSPDNIKCFSETQPVLNYTKTLDVGTDWDLFTESHEVTKAMKKVHVHFINITALSEIRKDAHTSVHTLRQGKLLTKEQQANPRKFADCIHWCLPGLPDTWNEFIYGHIVSSPLQRQIENQSAR